MSREKLKDLGRECIIVDMGKGAHEQTLIGAYAAFQSDDRFAISELVGNEMKLMPLSNSQLLTNENWR
jgi:hypothetical protein